MRDPETPEEWQAAVDAAHACLCLDSARQYGPVEGGPAINYERCREILELGKIRGVVPAPDAIERTAGELSDPDPRGPGPRERAAADLV